MSAPNLVPPGTTGGGAPVGGSGTAGKLAKWATTTTLNDSVITQSGTYIGIGTASPGTTLAVQVAGGLDSVTDILSLKNPSGTSAGVRVLLQTYYGSMGAISARQTDNGVGADDGILDFQTSTDSVLSAKMTILSGGNVGIGVTAPAAKLDVVGSSADTDFRLSRTGGSIYFAISAPGGGPGGVSQFFINGVGVMTLQDTGNVGIGTVSPTAALDLPASTTTRASLRIQTGTAPTSPNNGDIWFDGTNILMRISGVTRTFTLV